MRPHYELRITDNELQKNFARSLGILPPTCYCDTTQLRTARGIDTGLPRPVQVRKMPSNLSFIHGPIAIRAINLAE